MRRLTEHGHQARDVLRFLREAQERGAGGALAVVTSVDGSSPRAPGALLAVTEDEVFAGYVSNGCVDADVAHQGLAALREGASRQVRYGEGSPYRDVRLPCGGSMELMIVPLPARAVVAEAVRLLEAREMVALEFDNSGLHLGGRSLGKRFRHVYVPPLQLAIAGKGMETVALARLAKEAQFDVVVFSPEDEVLQTGGIRTARLMSPQTPPTWPDDPWTAIVLLFHDHDGELTLLRTALATRAFYVGAMGAARTHEARCRSLAEAGVPGEAIARIRAPIGLVPSSRDASSLAVSVLAEIVAMAPEKSLRRAA